MVTNLRDVWQKKHLREKRANAILIYTYVSCYAMLSIRRYYS